MTKRKRLQLMLKKLDELEKSGHNLKPMGNELSELTERILREEMGNVEKKVKDNATLRSLHTIAGELESFKTNFKKDFDLNPLVERIEEIREELGGALSATASEYADQLESLQKTVNGYKKEANRLTNEQALEVTQRLLRLEQDFSDREQKLSTNIQGLSDTIGAMQSLLETTRKELSNSSEKLRGLATNEAYKNVITKSEEKTSKLIEKLRSDFLARLSNLGGGNANRNITLGGSSLLTRYTDVNLIAGSNITLAAGIDDTNKRTNLTISGAAGAGGTPAGSDQQIQYNDGGSFGASSILTWNKNTSVLSIGVGHYEGHAIWGDASDGFFIKTTTDKAIVSFGPANTANVTFYGPTNFASTISVTGAGSIKGALSVGQAGSAVGAIDFSGNTSGTMRIQPASIAGGYVLTLPPDDGTSGQYLLTDGNGITQWASVTAAGGSGIQRITSIITANTTGGSTASRDYIYFANAGLAFTLPTAVGNTNLYTLKNMAASSVLVNTSAGETVDGSATALLSSPYDSLSFQSNGSVWGVT